MTEHVSGNVFLRPNRLAKIGDVTHGHEHHFDHTTYVTRGGVNILRLARGQAPVAQDFLAGSHALIAAGVRHEITAIGDRPAIWECEQAQRDLAMALQVQAAMPAGPGRDIMGTALTALGGFVDSRLAQASATEYHCIYAHRTPQG